MVIVFLGPSLPVNEARSILTADYRPPATAGDIYAAALCKPRAIGLIDGLFEAVPAVWHKEILYALTQGIAVFGSFSMGALRAAELQCFGMQGVGKVYASYAAGELEDDDEVALLHGPAETEYRPLTVPMVNVREALRLARGRDLISSSTHDRILRLAKDRFYADRRWPDIGLAAIDCGIGEDEVSRLLEFVERTNPDVKQDDARELIKRLAAATDQGIPPFKPNFTLQRSIFFHRLAEATKAAVGRTGEEADNPGKS